MIINARRLMLIAPAFLCVASLVAQDLSSYRKFAFGADLAAVAKETGLKPANATTICQRPALIQDLEWRPNSALSVEQPERNSAKEVAFRFYNGTLARVAVTYERAATEGLTVEDMIDSVSSNYGPATKSSEEMIFPSIYREKVKVLGRWENAEYSFSLIQSLYPLTFGLVGISKHLDALANAATEQAKVIEAKGYPQKESARRDREEAESRAELEKMRLANKSGFKP
jgi:hypothetical protein